MAGTIGEAFRTYQTITGKRRLWFVTCAATVMAIFTAQRPCEQCLSTHIGPSGTWPLQRPPGAHVVPLGHVRPSPQSHSPGIKQRAGMDDGSSADREPGTMPRGQVWSAEGFGRYPWGDQVQFFQRLIMISASALVLACPTGAPTRAQSTDADTLSRQVDDLVRAGKNTEAIPLAQRALA